QTNCLRSGDATRWNTLYGALLGIWDNTQMLVIRDGQGKPTGEVFASNDSLSWHNEIRAMDTWRVNQALTVNYGANILIETPWADRRNREYFIANATTGQLIDPKEVLSVKQDAASRGLTYNAPVAYVPRERVGSPMYPTVFEVGPRVGAAWSPTYHSGLLGKLIGERKTVLRGGYSLLFDRIMATVTITSQISSNEILNNSASILRPVFDFAGTPRPSCMPRPSPLRIGVDGVPSAPPGPGTLRCPSPPRRPT